MEVLLVEDSPGDVRLTQEAFRDTSPPIHLHVARDGVEAMVFLKHEGAQKNAPRPDLILLDLNLPKMDGRELLATIKGDSAIKAIPVIVLTTSGSEADILKTYRLRAKCYLTKPVDLNEFLNVVKSIDDFWLARAKLPSEQC